LQAVLNVILRAAVQRYSRWQDFKIQQTQCVVQSHCDSWSSCS